MSPRSTKLGHNERSRGRVGRGGRSVRTRAPGTGKRTAAVRRRDAAAAEIAAPGRAAAVSDGPTRRRAESAPFRESAGREAVSCSAAARPATAAAAAHPSSTPPRRPRPTCGCRGPGRCRSSAPNPLCGLGWLSRSWRSQWERGRWGGVSWRSGGDWGLGGASGGGGGGQALDAGGDEGPKAGIFDEPAVTKRSSGPGVGAVVEGGEGG
jgi:hypothetical protein